ncbi:MAG: hypothetical protein EOP45_10160 [Sphingobacteriaceae bacterium]|nr:MAG: hypothetical protein EOP45_10160 [Sphingobacteriaceae bacterium]
MQVIKPERWMELLNNDAHSAVDSRDGSNPSATDDESVSIQIAWTHFVKYMASAKISSEIRFYIRADVRHYFIHREI